jgi:hypothetical protein
MLIPAWLVGLMGRDDDGKAKMIRRPGVGS